ncbi:hypothetical protein HEK616_06930 [Streptomyces nigrescens]|uniref:Serine peptidase n=1 Tax=Streptomyces nigrescens TaxID=1920 RepID=A0ABN6QQN7_STRNI|nr:hypothetical protein [Streptomyces nigrescens]BDM67206.1 hypothetical protein HEK616_06930 [Streptomyces nigrescens]
MRRVLGVHGVGNFRPGESARAAADTLAVIWHAALTAGSDAAGPGPAGVDVAVAYYADLLREPGRQAGAPTLEDLDAFEQELLQVWAGHLGLPEGVAAGRATAPVRQALAWLAERRGLGRVATEWFVATFFREVAAYLRESDGAIRCRVRERIAAAIDAHRPQVVIAHSLGSVATYEALWAHPGHEVDLLVTVGSPLALPHAVFPRLQPPLGDRGRRPPGVRRWVDLADPGDLVALPPGGVEARFEGVEPSPGDRTIHAFDFHQVKNYLASPCMATILRKSGGGGQ